MLPWRSSSKPGHGWFTGPVLAFTVGMVIFFGLSIKLTGMRDEGERERRFMVVMTVVFSALLVLQIALL